MKNFVRLVAVFTFSMFISCGPLRTFDADTIVLADKDATRETKILYRRVSEIGKEGIAFGHQDATAYGIGWKHEDNPQEIRSDIKDVTGKLPAVHGFDLGHIELGESYNLDTVSFALMKDHIREMHKKGAIITFSWHLDNPVTNKSSWDPSSAVSEILTGGSQREKYELWVKRISTFFLSLKDDNGKFIPVIFRPYHEMNGGWFWWGEGNVSNADYKQLWKETLELLQFNGVHNLLYAYSPNIVSSEEEYEKYYPGDAYVDILGVDIYNHGGDEVFVKNLKSNLEIVKRKAGLTNKPYALSETGNNNFGEGENWWTQVLYPGIKNSGISWVLLWRNDSPSHYFSTYKGEISEEDFKEFESFEEILFLDEVEDIFN
jgi:mannan endo-1,4-beta-mannosidase